MIEVENLSKRYGNQLAVDGLNFMVQPGIVTGFLGPNGCAKSTAMRMIAGLGKPTAGRVTVNGGDSSDSLPGDSGASTPDAADFRPGTTSGSRMILDGVVRPALRCPYRRWFKNRRRRTNVQSEYSPPW